MRVTPNSHRGLVFTFTFNCPLGKTHNHRSRGDTPCWEAQTMGVGVSVVLVFVVLRLSGRSFHARVGDSACPHAKSHPIGAVA